MENESQITKSGAYVASLDLNKNARKVGAGQTPNWSF